MLSCLFLLFIVRLWDMLLVIWCWKFFDVSEILWYHHVCKKMVGKDPCYSISKELKKYISKEIQNKKFQENEISYSLLHICRRKLRCLDCGMVSEAVCLIADASFIFCFFSIICSKLGNFVKSLSSLLYHKFFMCLCHVFLFKKTKSKIQK